MRYENLRINYCVKFLLLAIGVIIAAPYCSLATASLPEKFALTSEEVQVYADFIESFKKTNFNFLLNKTIPLDLSAVEKDAACLQGLQFEGARYSSTSIHSLGSEVLRGQSIHVIDDKEQSTILRKRDADAQSHDTGLRKDNSGMTTDPGVLVLSEILFDKSHQFAVIKYVFLCGSRCNSGAILVLEKVGPRWTSTTRRPCRFEVNRDNPLS